MSMCGGCSSAKDENVTDIKDKAKSSGKDLVMTKEAAEYIEKLLEKDDKRSWGLKLEVVPGGCAGYKYYMAFQEKPFSDDLEKKVHGVKLFITQESLNELYGSTIGFVESLEASGLKIDNPNATRACGCGKSFG